MTIQRAREILGTEVVSLSDQEVTNLIYSTGQFADTILDIIVDTSSTMKGTNMFNNSFKTIKNNIIYGNYNTGTAFGSMAYNKFSGTITP